jgi:predicted NBD/HSP70 family sugar kinase
MLQATNISKAKLINLWVVFEAVRIHGPIPRIRLAQITGLSKQATSDQIDELLELGFVREEQPTEKRVGKPPKPLSINPHGALTIGFHVDHRQVATVITDLGGTVLHRETLPIDDPDPKNVASRLKRVAERLIADEKINTDRFLGIGLATPGPFNVPGIAPPRLPGWDGLAVARHLREMAPFPVTLANDGQSAITAEWRFGNQARTLTNFVYVYLGNGLGSGVMLQGAAFGGGYGNAGEFGHTISVPDGDLCGCGKRGCLETYVSVDSLTRFLANNGSDISEIDALEPEFRAGHPLVAQWIERARHPLRIGLNTLENLFDPQTIMFGGDAPDWLISAFIEGVQPLYPSVSARTRDLPRLMRADLGADAVARGAAVLPVLAMLNPQYQELTQLL